MLLQHFRGNLDNWDPALVDALARASESSPSTTPVWGLRPAHARHHRADGTGRYRLRDCHGFDQADLLGFSIGSFVAQEIALTGRRWYADWSWPPPLPRERPECTAGHPRSSTR